jgi:hypothetical protein
MLSMLIGVIILALIFALAYWVISILPLPAPFPLVLNVVLALMAILVLIGLLTGDIGNFHGCLPLR